MQVWQKISIIVFLIFGLQGLGSAEEKETDWFTSTNLNLRYFNPLGATKFKLSYRETDQKMVSTRLSHAFQIYDITLEPMFGTVKREETEDLQYGLRLNWRDLRLYGRASNGGYIADSYYKWFRIHYRNDDDTEKISAAVRFKPFSSVAIEQGISYDNSRELIISTIVNLSFDIGHPSKPKKLLGEKPIEWQ